MGDGKHLVTGPTAQLDVGEARWLGHVTAQLPFQRMRVENVKDLQTKQWLVIQNFALVSYNNLQIRQILDFTISTLAYSTSDFSLTWLQT